MYELRRLYEQYGYSRYKVSKFEEYDLYAKNKSFLVSENILTFTDTNGKLMALKPDVTLSIVKNIHEDDADPRKLYYNETVYRPLQAFDGFREIMQTGLECIGSIDLYSMGEVLTLAKKSLALISEEHILDISHMGFLQAMLSDYGIAKEEAPKLLYEIGNKNIGAVRMLCRSFGVEESAIDSLCTLCALYEPLDKGLECIRALVSGETMQQAYNELCGLAAFLRAADLINGVYLDFSMINDMRYYNGVIFRGFIKGIPNGVLSGGRYDSLLQKMEKKCGAIGFAVYLDQLERMEHQKPPYDTDIVILYDDTVSADKLSAEAEAFRAKGLRVLTLKSSGNTAKCKTVLRMTERGVEALENHD